MGVFTYSHEENTYAGNHCEDEIPEEIKEQRMEEVMEIQQDISLEINRSKLGQTLKTIIDRKENDYYVGRTEFDSPEVDNEVIVRSKRELEPGKFYSVKMVDALEYDLIGELIEDP